MRCQISGTLGDTGPGPAVRASAGSVLPAKTRQLLLLLRGQTVMAATLVEIGLAEPVPDGGVRDAELPSEALAGPAGSSQVNDPGPEFRWVWRLWLRHSGIPPPQSGGLHIAGSTPCSATKALLQRVLWLILHRQRRAVPLPTSTSGARRAGRGAARARWRRPRARGSGRWPFALSFALARTP
jgi:hypothetical protein